MISQLPLKILVNLLVLHNLEGVLISSSNARRIERELKVITQMVFNNLFSFYNFSSMTI